MNEGNLSDSALGVFPEPIALVGHDRTTRTLNAAWQLAFSEQASPLQDASVQAGLGRVLSGEVSTVDVTVDLVLKGSVARYSVSLVAVPQADSPAVLVHARKVAVPAVSPGESLEGPLLRRMLHLLPISVGLSDADGKTLFINDTGARLLGRSRDEIEGKSHHDFLAKTDAAIAREVEARVLATGTEEIITADIESPLGLRSIFFHFIAVEGDKPGERFIVSVGQDVTEQFSAERDLREQQEFIRQVIDSDPNLIFVKDDRGTFLLANKAVADLFGKSVEEMVGLNDRAINTVADGTKYLSADQHVLSTLEELTVEEPVRWLTGEVHWYQTTKRPLVRTNGEVQLLGCSVDITARRETLKKLEEANAEVELRAAEAFRQAEAKAALVVELDSQLSIIETQHQEILSLSAPLLEVGENILAVPIVGVLSDSRAVEIMTRLLEAIVDKQLERVVIDLTGLETIETNTADQLLGIVRAIRLLGAEAIISGIRPAVAQTIVELGIDLSTLNTHRTLRSAIFMDASAKKALKRKGL